MSRQWSLAVGDIRIDDLVYSTSSFRSHFRSRLGSRRPWFLTKDEISPGNIIDLYPICKLSRCPFDLTNVQRLRIDAVGVFRRTVDEFSWNLNWNEFLANFPRLSHLEIYRFDEGYEQMRRITLDLPDTLTTFCLSDAQHVIVYLNSSARLQNVSCDTKIVNIRFTHPESITHLRINDWIGYHLSIFPNVECIYFGKSTTFLYDYLNLISLFPRMKEIHFEYGAMKSDLYVKSLEIVINWLVVDRKNVKVFYDGTRMHNVRSFRIHVAKVREEIKCKRSQILRRNSVRRYRSKSC